LAVGEASAFGEASLDIIVSSVDDGTDVGGSGAEGLTKDVSGSEREGWTLKVVSSVHEPSLEHGTIDGEGTSVSDSEEFAGSGIKVGGTEGRDPTVGLERTATDRGPQPTTTEVFEETGHEFLTRLVGETEAEPTEAALEISGELLLSETIRITSRLVIPPTGGAPTAIWIRLESTPWPTPWPTP
jgi:hypothetical protein